MSDWLRVVRRSLSIYLLMLSSPIVLPAQPIEIPWTAERRLTWGDFKARPDRTSNHAAMTDSGIAMAVSCVDDIPKFTVSCSFNSEHSWVKVSGTTELLRHEQLHFDITELYTRRLRKELAAISDCLILSEKAEALYEDMFEANARYQDSYDLDTGHGTLAKEQTEWESRIATELAKMKWFASK